jgi:hypothetical protein
MKLNNKGVVEGFGLFAVMVIALGALFGPLHHNGLLGQPISDEEKVKIAEARSWYTHP